jgi:hypothetical protein
MSRRLRRKYVPCPPPDAWNLSTTAWLAHFYLGLVGTIHNELIPWSTESAPTEVSLCVVRFVTMRAAMTVCKSEMQSRVSGATHVSWMSFTRKTSTGETLTYECLNNRIAWFCIAVTTANLDTFIGSINSTIGDR